MSARQRTKKQTTQITYFHCAGCILVNPAENVKRTPRQLEWQGKPNVKFYLQLLFSW